MVSSAIDRTAVTTMATASGRYGSMVAPGVWLGGGLLPVARSAASSRPAAVPA